MKRLSVMFWKTYYKFKFGENYQTRINNAARLVNTIHQSTDGNLSSFYDKDGNQIRGWHKHIKFPKNTPIQHPLITKYSK